ncbi:MAG: hypothetical protein PHU14_10100, partial [Methylovulum sp.]|nr:hypothetical protein [Methylovulum sp.]
TANYSYTGTVPTTAQLTYNAGKDGGGLRFGITFRFMDNGTYCGPSSAMEKTKNYAFNLVANIFDERFEYIDIIKNQAGEDVQDPNFTALMPDSTGQKMYRYSLRYLVDYDTYVLPESHPQTHYNPFKVRGVTTPITNKNLIPVLNDLIPQLVADGTFPAAPSCPAGHPQYADYTNYIIKHIYVPTASTGYETGGINDLSFSLFEFSLVGTNTQAIP